MGTRARAACPGVILGFVATTRKPAAKNAAAKSRASTSRAVPSDADRRTVAASVLVELHRRIEARTLAAIARQGMSINAFATSIGMGAAHLRRIMRGPRADRPTSPSLAVLARIAQARGLDTWQLIAPLSSVEEAAAHDAAAKLGIDFAD